MKKIILLITLSTLLAGFGFAYPCGTNTCFLAASNSCYTLDCGPQTLGQCTVAE